ncbi:hypothetical protein CHH83_01315 [Bacillus sp. 7586-K]|nr:hypothetical protein CHH83_01315 [Bacillus sp. 7586-K]
MKILKNGGVILNTQLEMIHSPKYTTAFQLTKRFVGKNAGRVVLTFALHKSDGTLIATDSHKLLRIKNIHGFKEEYLINPRTFEAAKGQYPDTDKLIPENAEMVFRLDQEQIKTWLKIHKSLKQMAVGTRETALTKLIMKQNSFEFEDKLSGITYKLPANEYKFDPKTENITFNTEYLSDALEVHHKLNSTEVFIKLKGTMRPFNVTDGNDIDALVLPVRTY